MTIGAMGTQTSRKTGIKIERLLAAASDESRAELLGLEPDGENNDVLGNYGSTEVEAGLT